MAKPKFEARLQVWVPTGIADAFEALAAGGMLTVSDHLRLALANHLQHLAINTNATSRQKTNGHGQHEAAEHGVV